MASSKKNKSKIHADNWTLKEIEEFLELLMDDTLCTDLKELKNHMILDSIWKKVANELCVDHVQLKNFWYYQLHMQLFCPEPIYYADVKIKLIEYLYGKGITDSKDIIWNNVLQNFDGYTTRFLSRVFNNLLKHARSKSDFTELTDLITYLHDTYISNLIDAYVDDKFLPRLVYNNGKLKHNVEDLATKDEISF